ncbi:hypothetical protein HDV06_006852 [Boothiomyces sp. JEL0866]|nr:hypothetical protein HDV06_006852 [Boothiomyces sp. JEL0866]
MEQFHDEILAIESIYNVNLTTDPIEFETPIGPIQFHFHFIDFKPSIDFKIPSQFPIDIQKEFEKSVQSDLKKCNDFTGDCVLYDIIEFIREYLESEFVVKLTEFKTLAAVDSTPDTKIKSNSTFQEKQNVLELGQDGYGIIPIKIYHSGQVVESKSVFVSHCATVNNETELGLVLEALLMNNRLKKATHNIVAYKFGNISDFDDDGEDQAGSRLLHLINLLNLDNVVVMVSRWFGGVLLGPSRFKIINNCARDLLLSAGYIKK